MRYSCSSLAPVPADLAVPQRQSLTVGQGADFVIVFGLFALSVSPNGQRGIVGHAYSCCGRQDVRGSASWSWQAQRVENPVEGTGSPSSTRADPGNCLWQRLAPRGNSVHQRYSGIEFKPGFCWRTRIRLSGALDEDGNGLDTNYETYHRRRLLGLARDRCFAAGRTFPGFLRELFDNLFEVLGLCWYSRGSQGLQSRAVPRRPRRSMTLLTS